MIPEGAIFGRTVETIVALMKYHPTLQEYSEISPNEAEEILREISGINSAVNASPETLERALLLLYQITKGVTK